MSSLHNELEFLRNNGFQLEISNNMATIRHENSAKYCFTTIGKDSEKPVSIILRAIEKCKVDNDLVGTIKKVVPTIIISGFPGVGKTYAFEHQDELDISILDSDSSQFNKEDFPKNYINHIRKHIGKVGVIFISSHKEVRDALSLEKIPFTILVPKLTLKNEYLSRYINRGNDENFINFIKSNWTDFIMEMYTSNPLQYSLSSNEFAFDFLKLIFKG